MESTESTHSVQPAVTVVGALPSISVLIKQTIAEYRTRFHKILPILAISFLVGVLQSVLSLTATSVSGAALYGIGSLLGTILIVLSYIALVIAFVDPVAESNDTTTLYSRAGKILLSSIWVWILTMLATLGATLLLIIPGIIVSILLSFALYILIAEEKKGTSALAKSWYYIRGKWWGFFGRMFVFGILVMIVFFIVTFIIQTSGLNTVGPMIDSEVPTAFNSSSPQLPDSFQQSLVSSILHTAFSSFVIVPISIIYLAVMYRAFRALKPAPLEESEEKKIKTKIHIFIGLGILMLVLIIALVAFIFSKFSAEFPNGIPAAPLTPIETA